MESIHVHHLHKASRLSPVKCADFSEAAAVCLDHHRHPQKVILTVEGDLTGEFHLAWEQVTQQMRDSRNDMEYTVESGAYCVAMLVVEKLTKLVVEKQSQKRTGFDYWLGKNDDFGLQHKARLEVSGILSGNKVQIDRRLKEKIKQTEKSDNLTLPAYVVIVEFSGPRVKIKKR